MGHMSVLQLFMLFNAIFVMGDISQNNSSLFARNASETSSNEGAIETLPIVGLLPPHAENTPSNDEEVEISTLLELLSSQVENMTISEEDLDLDVPLIDELLLPGNAVNKTENEGDVDVPSFLEILSHHVENRTGSEGEGTNYYDNYEYDLLTAYSIDYESEDNTSLYDFGDGDRARWSYAPAYFENKCRQSCLDLGKPFSRLVGVRCQCLCPLNAPTLNLCEASGKCDRYCSKLTYYKGGDCIYNNVCFCYCKGEAPYDVSRVYA